MTALVPLAGWVLIVAGVAAVIAGFTGRYSSL
jgi:hypothetical protein